MPDEQAPAAAEQAATGASAPAAEPAYNGLPAEVQAALAEMPDIPNPATSTATEAQGTETPAKDEKPAEGGTEQSAKAEGDKPAITAEAIKAALEAGLITVDDVVRIPGVDGKVGALAAKRFNETVAGQQAEAERQRKLALAQGDPDHPLSQEVLREAQAADSEKEKANLAGEVLNQQVGALGIWLSDKFTKDALKEYADTTAGKQFSVPELFEQTYQIRHKHELTAERAKWEKEARPAIEKEIRAQLELNEPDVQLNAGGAPASRTLTQKQIDDMDWREYARLEKDISSGRIKLVA